MVKRKIRWGFLGVGKMALKFAEGFAHVPDAELYAISSRSALNGISCACPVFYQTYEELVSDPLVDIVYISTPNSFHYEHTMLCLEAGKAVLCEKPFAMNSSQVAEMIRTAQEKKLFLMEALWTRFLPSIAALLELLNQNMIGDPQILNAAFGFKAQYSPESRLFDPKLGGGSLLDIGIYPVFLALLLFGKPARISAQMESSGGVDISTTVSFSYGGGRIAQLLSSFAVRLDTVATIYGTEGKITLHDMFHMPTTMSITCDGITDEVPLNWEGNGYNYEIAHVTDCLIKGYKESPLLPLSFSTDMMELLDSIRLSCEDMIPAN